MSGGIGQLHQQVTIGFLPDDVLLKILKFFIDDGPWFTLIHICRRWRNLAFTSPRHLNLELFCNPLRKSVKELVDIWPELPIYIWDVDFQYASKECVDYIAAVLRLNHRVSGIYFDNTEAPEWEIFEPLMHQPFPVLKRLWLQPHASGIMNGVSLSFLGGSAPCLRDLTLVRVSFPALPELLLSATNLVNITYAIVSRSGYISPQAMVTGLSALTRLESLSLTFRSPGDLPARAIQITPPDTRTLLPSLTDLRSNSSSEYIEDFVAQIDTPLLESVQITLFNQEVLEVSELSKFLCRADKLSLPNQAEVLLTSDSISITLSPKLLLGKTDTETLMLNLRCDESALRLSYLAQFYASFLPTLSPFESLHIDVSKYRTWRDVIDNPDPRWMELLRLFNTVKDLLLSKTVAHHVAQALRGLQVEQVTEVLPALEGVYISELEPSGPVWEAISEFADARQLSGHPVSIYDWKGEVYYSIQSKEMDQGVDD